MFFFKFGFQISLKLGSQFLFYLQIDSQIFSKPSRNMSLIQN